MRLLVIALFCLAASSSALPKPKEKRLALLDNVAGYATSHDGDVVVDTRSTGARVRSIPEVVHDVYGAAGYEPGLSFANEYLPPVGLIKVSTPVPTYAAADTVYVPGVQQAYVKPEVTQTVSSTAIPVPLAETKTVTVASPTSYSLPVAETVKNSVETGGNSHVKSTVKTVKTEIHEEEQNVPSSVVKVLHEVPAVDDVARFSSTVKTVPAVTTTVTKNVVNNVPVTGGLSSLYDSYAKDYVYSYPTHPTYASYSSYPSYGSYLFPFTSYSSYSPYSYYSYPSSLYSTPHHSAGLLSYDLLPNGYSKVIGLPAPLLHPISTYGTKTFGAAYSLPHTVPAVTSHQPYALAHAVSRVQEPVRTLSVPSVSPVSTLLPLQSLAPVPQLHTVQSVKSVNTPVQHTVHTVQSVPTVKYTKTVTPVQHTVPLVKTVETVTPAPDVHSEEIVKTATAVHPVKSVEILAPVHPTEPCHTVTKLVKTQAVPVTGEYAQKGFLDAIVPLFNPLAQFPNIFPQVAAPAPVTTDNPESLFLSSTPLPTALLKETASVSNPVLVNAQVVSSTVSPLDIVQPTHADGGYLY